MAVNDTAIEEIVHRHELHVTAQNPEHVVPLAQRVAAGRAVVPGGTLQSVSPPAGPTADTTRVLFSVPNVSDGYSTTAFVDPYRGKVRGVLATYGQWLPVRAWLDTLHRTFRLGAFGRSYSELAASWLWVEVPGGLALWLGARRRKGERLRRTLVPQVRGGAGRRRTRSWHAVVGLAVSLGLLGLSATGLTWSNHAGTSIGELRAQLKGSSPSVFTTLPAAHIGLLFGLTNQIVLALLAVGLITVILLGYRMWWLRRPTRPRGTALDRAPTRGAWRRIPAPVLAPAIVTAAALGYYLPLLGLPLLVFLTADLAAGAVVRRRAATEGAR